jgi:hypothetical protein
MADFEGTGLLRLRLTVTGAGGQERVRCELAALRLTGDETTRVVGLAGRRLDLTAKDDFTATLEVTAPAGKYKSLRLLLGPVRGLSAAGTEWVSLAPAGAAAWGEMFTLKKGGTLDLTLPALDVSKAVGDGGEDAPGTAHWHVVAGAGREVVRAELGSWKDGRLLLGALELAPGAFAPGTELLVKPGTVDGLPALLRGQRALGPVVEVIASAVPSGVLELTLPYQPDLLAAAGLRPEQMIVMELAGDRSVYRELRPHAVDPESRTVRVRARALSAFFPCSPGLLVDRPDFGVDAAGDVVAFAERERAAVSGRAVDERAAVTLAPAAGGPSWTAQGWFVFEEVPLGPADTVLTFTVRVAGLVDHVCEVTVRRAQPTKTVARPNVHCAGSPAFATDGTPFVSAVPAENRRLEGVDGIDRLQGMLATVSRNVPALFRFDSGADSWQHIRLLPDRFWGNEFARLAIDQILRAMQLTVPINAAYPAAERELRSLADFVATFPPGNSTVGLAIVLGIAARALGAENLSVSSRLPVVPLAETGDVGCALVAATFDGLQAAGRSQVPSHLRFRHVPRRDDRHSAFGLSVLAGRLFYVRVSRQGVRSTEVVADEILCAGLSLRLHPATGQPAILALAAPPPAPGVADSALLRLFQRQADGTWSGETVLQGQPVLDADFDFGPAGEARVVAAVHNGEELNASLLSLSRTGPGAWANAPLRWNLAGFPGNTTLGMWPQVAIDDQLRTHCAFSFFTPDAVFWLHARQAGGPWEVVQVGEGRREDVLGIGAAVPPTGFSEDIVGFSRVSFHHWAPALARGAAGTLWYAWGNGLLHLSRVDAETLAVGDRIVDLDRSTGYLPRLTTRGGPLRSAAPAIAYRDPHGEGRISAFDVELAAGLDLHFFDLSTSHQVPRREPPRLAPRRSLYSAYVGDFGRRVPFTCGRFSQYISIALLDILDNDLVTSGELKKMLDDTQASLFLNCPIDFLVRPQEQRLEVALRNDQPTEPDALRELRLIRLGERPFTLTATDSTGMSGGGVCGFLQSSWNAIAEHFIDLPLDPGQLFPPIPGVTIDEIRVTGVRVTFEAETPARRQQGGIRFRITLPDVVVTGSKFDVGFTAVSTEPTVLEFVTAPYAVNDRIHWYYRSLAGHIGQFSVDTELDFLTYVGVIGAVLTGHPELLLLTLVDPVAGIIATDITNNKLAERGGLPLGGLPGRLAQLLSAHALRGALGTDPDLASLDFDAAHLEGFQMTYALRRPGRAEPEGQTLLAFFPEGRRELGQVEIGEESARRVVVVANNGHFPISLQRVAVVGSTQFALDGPVLWPRILLPGDAVDVGLRLRPTGTAGPRTATLQADWNGNRRITLTLSGEALPAPEAHLQVAPPQLSFGVVNVGNTATLGVQIANPGGAPLQISELRLEGAAADRALFALPGTQPTTVAAGGTAQITVSFTPATMVLGGHRATLVILSNAAGTPRVEVPLFGSGAVSQLLVVPTAIAFNDSPLAAVLPPGLGSRRNLTVYNTGVSSLTLSGASLRVRDAAGQTSPHFQLLDAAGLPVAANNVVLAGGALLALSVQFRPVVAGLHQATVEIATTAPVQSAVVTISGRGVA